MSVKRPARSKLELALDNALTALYPHSVVLHDMPIKVGGRTLYVDRVIKTLMIAIEADGKQHEEFSAHFHGTQAKFADHKYRDTLKEEWLADNGYTLIRIKHDQDITVEWLRSQIMEALT